MIESEPEIASGISSSTTRLDRRFAAVVHQYPDRIAVSAGEEEWTYAELHERSDAIAVQVLTLLGPGAGPVALLHHHSAELVAAILGVIKAGKISLALEPSDPPIRWQQMVHHAGVRLVLTDPAHAAAGEILCGMGRVVAVAGVGVSAAGAPAGASGDPGDRGACLYYTSGSTGAPKGVWHNHASILHHAGLYAKMVGATPDDRFSLLTSCSLAASATPLFTALLSGATLSAFHVRSQGSERLVAWLKQHGITVYHSVPTLFRHMTRALGPSERLESLRMVRLGGEAVLPCDIEAVGRHGGPGCRLMHALSSTETGLIAASVIDPRSGIPAGRVSVGQPVCDAEIGLLNEQGEEVAPGEPGQIRVRSSYLAAGYWGDPEATQRAFQTDPTDPERRSFLTGDLARRLADGTLEHLGRVDQQVKIRGQRADLSVVEAALAALPGVASAAVAAPTDAHGERRLVAYVSGGPGAELSGRTLRRELQPLLPPAMVPTEYVVLERLPLTSGGKVDRSELPGPTSAPARAGAHQAMPRDSVEKRLAAIWEAVLGVTSVGRLGDFFDLGGTSIDSAAVLARVEDQFCLALPPSTLAEHSTVEALAAVVAGAVIRATPSPLVCLRGGGGGRPLFLMHGGKGDVAMYGQLARRLGPRPIYALQSIGMNGESWPLMSIGAMARRYRQEIRSVDPTGPYLLAGTCMGGLIALEIAQQFLREGCAVSFLALLDSDYPAPRGRRLRWTERAIDPVRDSLRMARWAAFRVVGMGRSPRWFPAYRRFVQHMNGRARRAYRPVVYPGVLTLVLAAEADYPGEDLRRLMGRFGKETRTITIPGRRADLFVRPGVEALARQLETCLAAAESPRRPATVC